MSVCYECGHCDQQYSYSENADKCCADLKERAAIVAWLRGPDPYPDGHEIADAIEAGEHWK